MTKVPQYAAVLKVSIHGVTVRARWGMHTAGSAIAGTLQSSPIGLDLRVQVDSDAPAAAVSRVVSTARRACHAVQALHQPMPTRLAVELRGEVIIDEREGSGPLVP
jgi:hypothetical protein